MPNPIREWPVSIVSRQMGFDRGTPIDRFYIEKFINAQRRYITGNVMEIGDNGYTTQFGSNISESYVLTADANTKECGQSKVIAGDLQGGSMREGFLDCFILTQTLPFIYDVRSAAANIVKMLKSGGVALVTVSGITMVSAYDDSSWGHYWGFTETSLRKIFEESVRPEQIEIYSYGNPKTASANLYGLCVEDLNSTDFETDDILTPTIIAAVIHK